MDDNITPKEHIKRLVIHVNGSDKTQHRDHDYVNTINQEPPAKQQKQLLYTVTITEKNLIHHCKVCGFKTMVKILLKKHMRTHKQPKSKNKPAECVDSYVICPQCSYYTKTQASLKVHMRIHFNGTPYKCTECEFFGKDLKELIKHYSTKDLSCEYCSYKTHIRSEMAIHQRRHSGEKPYACGICNYSACDRSNLHRHLKSHNR